MKLTFLGTGGGRFIMLTQLRATGGFILEMDGEMIHVDPGPGAVVRAAQNRINLRKLTGVVVTHNHTDHATDASAVVEAMTLGAKKKKGVVIGNEHLVKGSSDGHYIPMFSKYHLNAVGKYYSLRPGESADIGNVRVTAVRTEHRDSKAIGILFEGSEKVGYTSDTEYFKGLPDLYMGCDCLIINCLRPRSDAWPEHMGADVAERVIGEAKPKLAVLTHLGIKFYKSADREAHIIAKNTGIKTVAARDNMVLTTGDGEKIVKGLKDFL